MTDKELVHNFWTNVKTILKQKDITRKTFCSDIGVKEKTLSAMICRDTPPDICLLTRIRDALDVEITELLYSLKDTERFVKLGKSESALLDCLRTSILNEGTLIKMIIAVLAEVSNVAEEKKKIDTSPNLKKMILTEPAPKPEKKQTEPPKPNKRTKKSKKKSKKSDVWVPGQQSLFGDTESL